MHGSYWEGVPQRATLMSNTWATARPCPYCGALFRAHLCPVWVQVTVLMLFGVGPSLDSEAPPEATPRSLSCEICLESFAEVAILTDHMRSAHHLQGLSFNLARDSVAGEPACAHCGTLYDCLSSLRSHIVQGRCSSFSPEAIAENLPIDEAWFMACTGGQLMELLQDPRQRMRLSLHCQLCGARYSRSSDLSNHQQGSHSRLWRLSQRLTAILVQLIYANGTCVCNPSLHVNRVGHICQPLRHLSMLYHMMDKIFVPFQASEDSLARLLTRDLPRPFRFLLEQIVTYRCFEKLWQDPECVNAMRSRCIFCGQEHAPSAMCQHLREAHPCSHLAFSFYMSTIAPFMLAGQTVDHQCNACQQIFNLPVDVAETVDPARQRLAQSHLLHNCPNLLQVVLLLTGLLHDGRLHDDSAGSSGPTPSLGNLQGPGATTGSSGTAAKSKRVKTLQNPTCAADATGCADEPGGLAPAAAVDGIGEAALPTRVATRKRVEHVPPHGQLRAFFQQRSKRRLVEHPDVHTEMAGAAQDQLAPSDHPAPASDPEPLHRPADQSDQAVGDQTRGSALPGVNSDQSDRREGQLGVPGLGSHSPELGEEQQEAHQHDTDVAVLPGTGGSISQPGSGSVLPVPSEQCEHHGQSMAPPTEPPCRPGMGIDGDTVPQQRMDADWNDAQTAHPAPKRPSQCHPTIPGTQTPEGQREREAQAEEPESGSLMMPPLSILMHVLSHLCLRNDLNWCFANSTIFCLLWSFMTMQCDFSALGEGFAEMIQFLPCHNLQLVALKDLAWFDRILQNWGSFRGLQSESQQDSSEFTAAALTWLQAPAVNMTWERRLEESGVTHAHDHGDTWLPITISFPASHAHLPDTQYTLTALVTRWMQVDGMVAALLQALTCVCLHVDRYFQTDAGEIQKSQCLLDMEAGCDLPVFTGPGLQREYVSYVLVAATAHLGTDQQGHYKAILKTRPLVLQNGHPMHWLITDDGQGAQPTWTVPDWFRCCANVFWLLRADSVHLHTYRPLAVDDPMHVAAAMPDDAATISGPTRPLCDAAASNDKASDDPMKQAQAVADETEAAILALLQAANVEKR